MNQQPLPAERISAAAMMRLLHELCLLVKERSASEVEIAARHAAASEAAQAQRERAQLEIAQQHDRELAAAEAQHTRLREQLAAHFQGQYAAAEREYQRAVTSIIGRFEAKKATAERARDETRWEATAVLEAVKTGALAELKESEQRIEAQCREAAGIGEQAVGLLHRLRQWRDYPQPPVPPSPPEPSSAVQLGQLILRAKQELQALEQLPVPRMFEGGQPFGYFLLVAIALVAPTAVLLGPAGWPWIALSACAAVALYWAGSAWLYRVARRQTTAAYQTLQATLAEAAVAGRRARETAHAHYQRRMAEATAQCEDEIAAAVERHQAAVAELSARNTQELAEADARYPALLAGIAARRDREIASADAEHAQRIGQIERRFQEARQRVEQQYAQAVAANDRQFERSFGEMAERWRTGVERFRTAIEEVHQQCDAWFPDWRQTDFSRREPPAITPPAFRIGHYRVSLGQIEGGLSKDERLRVEPGDFALPALLPFPERSLLLVKSPRPGHEQAVRVIQAAMLRMLTSMPPGRVRLTIIDPVGLGRNFSAFMHLADYQEQLVTSRIWTDPGHIEQRLADLTDHMADVIQVYLRNEFDSIRQYNDFAGELAEAYRVLVVAGFPNGFTEAAARKLKSIVASGARCGVFTLMEVDPRLPMPQHFHLDDLVAHALLLEWRDGQFLVQHPEYGPLPLVLDQPPEAEHFTQLVRMVGSRVLEAGRVEVPFECVVPEEERWWTADSHKGLDVPLGRAGAKKLQHLSLGSGTSHHVLVAGKTGSGKSNLMHALIVNLGLHYAPGEVELYLIDFKKGVEFKPYAGGQMPHVRVVAIESEREFGLSVLGRLDEELRRRGDLFRQARVQDLPAYRAAVPQAALPRILLVVDEFQELFVEDDRIAQDAALFLDRLVRQGRAFGIHVLLGSQTLAGAYSLARSTIGQMAVRIALQCSEADAHLILSEENTAARLLSRPGEAIYNDANGLFEGNHPFQIVWLPDQKRDRYLERIGQLATSRQVRVPPPIVFEGNAPADPAANPLLGDLLAASDWPDTLAVGRAWLGAPVAIKDPTAAEFVRQGASNLLVVGNREEAVVGMLASSLIGLAAQHPPWGREDGSLGARFYVFDSLRPGAPATELWQRVAAALPHKLRLVSPREAASAVEEIAGVLAARQRDDQGDSPPVYLFVDQLTRFRDLRKAEDEFGFSSLGGDKPAGPAEQFATILREGPEFGIHTVLWFDTYNSLARSLDRQGLRDLETRVLFQISAADSSNLIDSPAASRLGVYRALLCDEGQGRLEKFRPYGAPSEAWLEQVGRQLHSRIRAGGSSPTIAPT